MTFIVYPPMNLTLDLKVKFEIATFQDWIGLDGF